MSKIWAFRAAILLSAYLLFQIELIMGRALLPVFGSSFTVWGVSLFFFQLTLTVGYAWAHFMQKKLGVARYARWHTILLLLPLICCPFRLDGLDDATTGWPMFFEVIRLLFIKVGLPFLSLSTTSLLVQRWLSLSDSPHRDKPYALYSASNLGSMIGLLVYPVAIEPLMSLHQQDRMWWILYAVSAFLQLLVLPFRGKEREAGDLGALKSEAIEKGEFEPNWGWILRWTALSASGTALLLSVTNLLTIDHGSMPLLWSLPLCVYLLTFVLLFKEEMWNPKWLVSAFEWFVPVGMILFFLFLSHQIIPTLLVIVLHLATLFFVCMRCHGRLVETRPTDHRYLTSFYLSMSVGGALGTLLVSGLVPLLSSSLIEYPGSFLLAALSVAFASPKELSPDAKRNVSFVLRLGKPTFITALTVAALTIWPFVLCRLVSSNEKILLFAVLIFLVFILRGIKTNLVLVAASLGAVTLLSGHCESILMDGKLVASHRSFYGFYRIFDRDNQRCFQHGVTLHGREYISGPKKSQPISYYHPTTPIGEFFIHPPKEFKNIAMIGLGAGVMPIFFHKGQSVTIYELDKDIIPLAENHFTYINAARKGGVRVKHEIGDGRMLLRKTPAHFYDVLIIDAFSSGAVPVHLLTVEAFQEYFRILKPDGLLLCHVSNKYAHLAPVAVSLANSLGLISLTKSSFDNLHPDADSTTWVAVCRDKKLADTIRADRGWQPMPEEEANKIRPWTDDYNSIFWLIVRSNLPSGL